MPDDRGRFVKGEHWRIPRRHWDRAWLEHECVELGRSAADLAAACSCTDTNIYYWLKRHGIPRRDTAGARKIKRWGARGAKNPMYGKIGAANPRFVDGSSPERQRQYVQGVGRAFLQAVLRRDGYRCRRCNAGKGAPKSLHVHHLAPWAGNAAKRFDEANVVVLCAPCHHWVHSAENAKREWLL